MASDAQAAIHDLVQSALETEDIAPLVSGQECIRLRPRQ